MSTEHEHGHDEGGHELEAINTKLLFRLMISLSIVTLLASAAVVQWYYSQRAELERRNAVEGSFLLAKYKERMAADLQGIDVVRKQILADGKVLQAPAPPPGWVHPDDLLSGGAAAAPAPAPMPAPAPADPVIDVQGQPAIPVPAGDVKPADEAKPEEAKPEEAKPEEAKPEEPKPAKPAKPENEGKGDEKKADEAKKEG